MCVILVVDPKAKDLTPDEFEKAAETNSDGFGIAWIEKGRVRFEKKVNKDVMDYKVIRPPKPYIMHFRIATVGGSVDELCHPFVVDKESFLKQNGWADKVLFHNGHWSEWNEWLAITFSGIGHLPKGPYSDSRTMALMLAYYGDQVLNISGATVGQKIATIDRHKHIKLYGTSWERDKEDGIFRSNENHLNSAYSSYGYYGSAEISKYNSYLYCRECHEWLGPKESSSVCSKCKSQGLDKNKDDSPTSATFCAVCLTRINPMLTVCKECDSQNIAPSCKAKTPDGKQCNNLLMMETSLVTGLCNKCQYGPPTEAKSTKLEREEAAANRRWYHAIQSLMRRIYPENIMTPHYFDISPAKYGNRGKVISGHVFNKKNNNLQGFRIETRQDTPENVGSDYNIVFNPFESNENDETKIK